MWIARKLFDGIVEDLKERNQTLGVLLQEASIHSRLYAEQNKVLQANLDSARLRLNQLERERAQLTNAILGVKIAVPEFVPISDAKFDIGKTLSEMPGFEDVGDEVAALMGVSHNADGTLKYSPTPGTTRE